MNQQTNIFEMLDMMIHPGFCVKDGAIVKVNQAAQTLLLAPGDSVLALMSTGKEEYTTFQDGCLYLQLEIAGNRMGASVTRVGDVDVFLLDMSQINPEFQALALAAKDLRMPLNNLIAISDTLLPNAISDKNEKVQDLMARISKNLYQMQRVLGNMSDAGRQSSFSTQSANNLTRVFEEIFEKAAILLRSANIQLCYNGPSENIYSVCDSHQLQRAVLNMLSNSAKSMSTGGCITASLTRQGDLLHLSVQDTGTGIASGDLPSIFCRYNRVPGLEDPRSGIGLGMVMIRSAAIDHGGTVLIDHPAETGVRITMTIKIRSQQNMKLRSNIPDIAGGRDQALIELSDCLPLGIYKKEL